MNSLSLSLFVLCTVSLFFWHADGACRFWMKRIQFGTEQKGKFYCSYRGEKWSNGVMLFPEVCEGCECRGNMMICCDIGTAANAGEYEGCTKVSRKCEVRYYKMVNGQKLDCFSDLPFDENFWLK